MFVRISLWLMIILAMWYIMFLPIVPVKASELSDAFEKEMFPIVADHGYAKAASMCGLRSAYWWDTLNTGIILYIQRKAHDSKMSDADKADAQKQIDSIENATIDLAFKNNCSALTNSPIMKRLDQLQYTITGGYH